MGKFRGTPLWLAVSILLLVGNNDAVPGGVVAASTPADVRLVRVPLF